MWLAMDRGIWKVAGDLLSSATMWLAMDRGIWKVAGDLPLTSCSTGRLKISMGSSVSACSSARDRVQPGFQGQWVSLKTSSSTIWVWPGCSSMTSLGWFLMTARASFQAGLPWCHWFQLGLHVPLQVALVARGVTIAIVRESPALARLVVLSHGTHFRALPPRVFACTSINSERQLVA